MKRIKEKNKNGIELDIPETSKPKRKMSLMRITIAIIFGITALGLSITYYMNKT